MRASRSDLPDLSYFLAIARRRSFRRAATELGISGSALSHAMRGLEERLGVRLINRTNRSLTLTAAGEELRAEIEAPFGKIGDALDGLSRFREAPAGRIRISAAGDAAVLLLGPVLPEFARRFPDVEVEISANNRMVDVIDSGFDAGIRYGGTVPEDMIAQRLSGDLRWVVVGAPSYLDMAGRPTHPNDLLKHRCINIRAGDDRIYRWEFDRGDEAIELAVPGTILVDGTPLALAMAEAGGGLFYMLERRAAPSVASGSLEVVLEDWLSTGSGFHIYYSSRRQLPSGLRALIALVKEYAPAG